MNMKEDPNVCDNAQAHATLFSGLAMEINIFGTKIIMICFYYFRSDCLSKLSKFHTFHFGGHRWSRILISIFRLMSSRSLNVPEKKFIQNLASCDISYLRSSRGWNFRSAISDWCGCLGFRKVSTMMRTGCDDHIFQWFRSFWMHEKEKQMALLASAGRSVNSTSARYWFVIECCRSRWILI